MTAIHHLNRGNSQDFSLVNCIEYHTVTPSTSVSGLYRETDDDCSEQENRKQV